MVSFFQVKHCLKGKQEVVFKFYTQTHIMSNI